MKIFVKVKPNAKQESVEKISDSNFIISVKAPPVQGKANQAVINALADFFQTSKSQINILVGHQTKNKIIEIDK